MKNVETTGQPELTTVPEQSVELVADPDLHEQMMRDAAWKHSELQIDRTPEVAKFRSSLNQLGVSQFQNAGDAWNFLQKEEMRILSFEQLSTGGYAQIKVGDTGAVVGIKPIDAEGRDAQSTHPYRFEVIFDNSIWEEKEESSMMISRRDSVVMDVTFADADVVSLERINEVVINNWLFSGVEPAHSVSPLGKSRLFLMQGSLFGLSAFRGSVSAAAIHIAYKITQNLLLDPSDALTALMTGNLPQLKLIDYRLTRQKITDVPGGSSYESYGPVCLEIQPWLSAESVAKQFRDLQAKLLGGENRQFTSQNLALFKFVVESIQKGVGLRRVFSLWKKEQERQLTVNNRKPEVEGNTKTSSSSEFWKAYRRVRRKLFPETEWSKNDRFAEFYNKKRAEIDKGKLDDPTFSLTEHRSFWRAEWDKEEARRRRI